MSCIQRIRARVYARGEAECIHECEDGAVCSSSRAAVRYPSCSITQWQPRPCCLLLLAFARQGMRRETANDFCCLLPKNTAKQSTSRRHTQRNCQQPRCQVRVPYSCTSRIAFWHFCGESPVNRYCMLEDYVYLIVSKYFGLVDLF